MNERVLITGASGFIGFHLVAAAVQAGLEVYAAVRPTSEVAQLEAFPIKYAALDFTDSQALQKALEEKQYHYIIHAAGTTRARSEQEYTLINAGFTKNLAMAAAAAAMPLRKFVFISSLAALGPIAYQDTSPIHEQSAPQPVTAYGRSKLLAEQLLAEVEGLPMVVLRPTAVYGPRERDIFILLKILSSGLDPYISRQPQRLSFVHATDLARAVMLALQAEALPASYNISDGQSYDRYALADMTRQVLGKKAFRFYLPLGLVKVVAGVLEAAYAGQDKAPALNREKLRELTAENWYCSIDRIRKELGFVPKYDLATGLAQTLQWYKENKWL
ncbi:NAD-dependent epimerase/dehydratase family protein [Pontibacter liquoris]|uniref:NAD-dependent epimerase/dehydratase family protein n=1 Tax=Pontibacter liquoris TaxID=2905677 RepID=UPI001FA7217A|nr:NAD-dependent epimerase/dehydratase family protein [Pontibacter liquoris]